MRVEWSLRLLVCLAIFFTLFISSARSEDQLDVATFAGGCFWCMQPAFDKVPGVIKTVVGYTGGDKPNPTYEEVSAGDTKHVEAIQVFYDKSKVTYEQLLTIFWHNVDPFDDKGQFCDKGSQYLSVIFYHDDQQKNQARQVEQKLIKQYRFNRIATELKPLITFYPAEDYHQGYYKKHPARYQFYRLTCGRDKRLEAIWKKS